MATLASATLDLARILPITVVDSVATSDGAAGKTTLVDGSFAYSSSDSTPPDDYYNGGTIFFKSCTNTGLNGTTAIVTDYVRTGGTFTFAAAAAQTKSGDTYSVINRDFPRVKLRQCINQALAEIGGEDAQNTALTTVADQMTYDLPAGVYNVIKVEVAASTTSPYGYVEHHHWAEVNDDIAFIEGHQPTNTGYIIRLTYRVPWAELTADSSAVADLINPNWLTWKAAVYALRWRVGILGEQDPYLRTHLTEAIAKDSENDRRYRPHLQLANRSPQHSLWSTKASTV